MSPEELSQEQLLEMLRDSAATMFVLHMRTMAAEARAEMHEDLARRWKRSALISTSALLLNAAIQIVLAVLR